jgi:hypothetical protein
VGDKSLTGQAQNKSDNVHGTHVDKLAVVEITCLIVFYLWFFNDVVSTSDCKASNDRIIDELERIWNELVVA